MARLVLFLVVIAGLGVAVAFWLDGPEPAGLAGDRDQAVAIDGTDIGARSDAAWPQGDIVVNDRSGWGGVFRAAMRSWNRAGLGIRFVPGPPERADLLVTANPVGLLAICGRNRCIALTSRIGVSPAGSPSQMMLPLLRRDSTPAQRAFYRSVAAHELGHVLGLTHRRRGCTLMAPSTRSDICTRKGDVLCAPTRADLRRAARMYATRPARARPWCDVGA